jgi:hypothetical protein
MYDHDDYHRVYELCDLRNLKPGENDSSLHAASSVSRFTVWRFLQRLDHASPPLYTRGVTSDGPYNLAS